MSTEYLRRTIFVRDHRTTISLEGSIWSALEEICHRESMGLNQICTLIDDELHKDANRTSAIRTFIVNYFRKIANDSKILKNDSLKPIGRNIKMLVNGSLGPKNILLTNENMINPIINC